jgi:hypothetical protein
MIATVIGIGATEIVSIAMGILILIVVIVRELAHLNMIRTLQSAVVRCRTGRRATGTTIAQACLLPRAVSAGMTIAMSVLVAAPVVITTDVSVASAKSSASDPTLAGPILVRPLLVCWITATVVVAPRQLDAVGKATRALPSVTVRQRYVKLCPIYLDSMALTSSQRARYSPRAADRKSKTPVPEPTAAKKEEEDRALRSGSEEGEIEED